MKLLRKLCILAAMACLAVGAFAQGNPQEILKELAQHRTTRMTEIRQSGKQLDQATFNAINAEVKAKAEAAIKDVDVAKIEAKDAYDWAQVFSIAEKHKDVCDLAHKFLMSSPTPEQKYAAQMMMMQSCNALGEADMLVKTLGEIKAPNATSARTLASMTVNQYVNTIAEKKGTDEALKVLSNIEKGMTYEDPAAMAARSLAMEKTRRANDPNAKPFTEEEEKVRLAALTTTAANSNDATRYSFAKKRADLFVAAKRPSDAVAELDRFIASLPAESRTRGTAAGYKNLLTITGKTAPALAFERQYGDFKGLEALKGKVVLLKFYAHW